MIIKYLNSTNCGVGDGRVFVYPTGDELSSADLLRFINYHRQKLLPDYIKSKNYYDGQHAILNARPKPAYKPDNRIVVNLPKFAVDTFGGFFNGIAMKVKHDQERFAEFVTQFRRETNAEAKEYELSQTCDIFGHAYAYLYQDEDSQTQFVVQTPIDTFVVYDMTVAHKPLYGVRYWYDGHKDLHGELISRDYTWDFQRAKTGEFTFSNRTPNPYGSIPIVEFTENTDRRSLFANGIGITDALNKTLSAKINDIEYFGDAYLKVIGPKVTDEILARLEHGKIFNLPSVDPKAGAVVDFMKKPDGDNSQEHAIDRLLDLFFQTIMVANVKDENFGQSTAGVALEHKLQPMKNLASAKERQFSKALKRMYHIVFKGSTDIQGVDQSEYRNLEFVFTRNIPRNITEEVASAVALTDHLSDETRLGLLSFINEPRKEIDKRLAERAERIEVETTNPIRANTYQQLKLEPGEADG